jgi:hypothetical protein
MRSVITVFSHKCRVFLNNDMGSTCRSGGAKSAIDRVLKPNKWYAHMFEELLRWARFHANQEWDSTCYVASEDDYY